MAPTRRQSQAEGPSRSMRRAKTQRQWRLHCATPSPSTHRQEAGRSGRGLKKQRGEGICNRGSAAAAQTPGWLQKRTPGGAFVRSQGATASPGEDKAQGMCLFSRWGKGLGASGPCGVQSLSTAQHSREHGPTRARDSFWKAPFREHFPNTRALQSRRSKVCEQPISTPRQLAS